MDYRRKFAAYASRPDAQQRLFGISLLESIFIPLPSDFLLIPMSLLSPDRAFRYAFVASLGSAAGALVSYFVGWIVINFAAQFLLIPQWILNTLDFFKSYSAIFLISAGFSSVPFNFVTFLSGVSNVNLIYFLVLCVFFRAVRYNLISWLIWRGGPRYQEWLERNFYGTMMVMTLALLVVSVIGILFFETA